MIYELIGTEINEAYAKEGTSLNQAYDIEGNEVFTTIEDGLTIMTYNVQAFTALNSNKNMQTSILNTYDADFIGFQEVSTSTTLPSIATELLTSYPYINQLRGNAMASKRSLTNITNGIFENQAFATESKLRRYQKAYFTYNNKTICWVNTHLETSDYESVKVAQAQEIFNLVQNEPYFIITGDFNTVCKSVNDTEYTTIMKQFVDAGYNVANCSNQHGFIDTWTSGSTASGTWYPCDHIITSSNIDIDTVIADTTKIDVASETGQSIDHLPLIAYLTIN